MKSSWKFLLLVFLFVGWVISCSQPPNAKMAELQRYYAFKGEGVNPPVKRVALKTTGRAGTMPDRSTAPVLGTTNTPAAPSSTNVPALSTTNAPATNTPSTNAPTVPW